MVKQRMIREEQARLNRQAEEIKLNSEAAIKHLTMRANSTVAKRDKQSLVK